METENCLYCGNKFDSVIIRRARRFCSVSCQSMFSKKKTKLNCTDEELLEIQKRDRWIYDPMVVECIKCTTKFATTKNLKVPLCSDKCKARVAMTKFNLKKKGKWVSEEDFVERIKNNAAQYLEIKLANNAKKVIRNEFTITDKLREEIREFFLSCKRKHWMINRNDVKRLVNYYSDICYAEFSNENLVIEEQYIQMILKLKFKLEL